MSRPSNLSPGWRSFCPAFSLCERPSQPARLPKGQRPKRPLPRSEDFRTGVSRIGGASFALRASGREPHEPLSSRQPVNPGPIPSDVPPLCPAVFPHHQNVPLLRCKGRGSNRSSSSSPGTSTSPCFSAAQKDEAEPARAPLHPCPVICLGRRVPGLKCFFSATFWPLRRLRCRSVCGSRPRCPFSQPAW